MGGDWRGDEKSPPGSAACSVDHPVTELESGVLAPPDTAGDAVRVSRSSPPQRELGHAGG